MKRIGMVVGALLLAGMTWAEVWIDASRATSDGDGAVALELRSSDETGRSSDAVESGRFEHLWKGGRRLLDPASARIPAGDAVHLVSFASSPQTGGRGDRIQHFAKSLIVVGRPAAGSPLRWSEVGHRLEIVPQTDPVELLGGGRELELQVLYDREPAADVRVEVIHEDTPKGKNATTDEIGVARVQLDRPGTWRVRVRHRARCELCAPPVMERLTSTLVVRVR